MTAQFACMMTTAECMTKIMPTEVMPAIIMRFLCDGFVSMTRFMPAFSVTTAETTAETVSEIMTFMPAGFMPGFVTTTATFVTSAGVQHLAVVDSAAVADHFVVLMIVAAFLAADVLVDSMRVMDLVDLHRDVDYHLFMVFTASTGNRHLHDVQQTHCG